MIKIHPKRFLQTALKAKDLNSFYAVFQYFKKENDNEVYGYQSTYEQIFSTNNENVENNVISNTTTSSISTTNEIKLENNLEDEFFFIDPGAGKKNAVNIGNLTNTTNVIGNSITNGDNSNMESNAQDTGSNTKDIKEIPKLYLVKNILDAVKYIPEETRISSFDSNNFFASFPPFSRASISSIE